LALYLVWLRGGKLASTRNGHRPALLPGTPGRPFETLFPPGSLKLPNAYILRPPALSRRPPLCLNAGIQAGRRPNRRQIHCMQTASSDEISCRNRFFPSQKWELGLKMSWIGRASSDEISYRNLFFPSQK
jgi:hypothetical protein